MLPPLVASESDHKIVLAPEVVIDLEAAKVIPPAAFKRTSPLIVPAVVLRFSLTAMAPELLIKLIGPETDKLELIVIAEFEL